MVSIADDVPAETKAKIDEIKAGLKAGTYAIWKGPIVGQDGKQILAKDAVADDKFLSGELLRQGCGRQSARRKIRCHPEPPAPKSSRHRWFSVQAAFGQLFVEGRQK